jgi:hypothetical protein
MKHLLRGREVPIAIAAGMAAAVAAGAFGLTSATASDPAPPIELDTGELEPVAPVPLDADDAAEGRPSVVSPAEPTVTEPTAPSVGSVASPAPAPRPAPAPPVAPVDSPPSPSAPPAPAPADADSPPSAGSIDS